MTQALSLIEVFEIAQGAISFLDMKNTMTRPVFLRLLLDGISISSSIRGRLLLAPRLSFLGRRYMLCEKRYPENILKWQIVSLGRSFLVIWYFGNIMS